MDPRCLSHRLHRHKLQPEPAEWRCTAECAPGAIGGRRRSACPTPRARRLARCTSCDRTRTRSSRSWRRPPVSPVVQVGLLTHRGSGAGSQQAPGSAEARPDLARPWAQAAVVQVMVGDLNRHRSHDADWDNVEAVARHDRPHAAPSPALDEPPSMASPQHIQQSVSRMCWPRWEQGTYLIGPGICQAPSRRGSSC